MNRLDYAFHHIECVVAIIAGRREAIDRMDISADGFWRSFSAIAVALPAMFFIWVLNARMTQTETPLASTAALIAGEAALEISLWLLPVLLFAVILKPVGLGHRFSHLIITRNWFNALFSYVVALAYVPNLFLTEDNTLVVLVSAVVMVAVLVAAVRITRVALDCTLILAIAFVAIEVIASLALAVTYISFADPSI